MNRSHLGMKLAMCVTAVAAAALHAGAQTQDGRALDNNLMVGSGGVNAPRQHDFTAGNALVTGNVAGLGYFRGDVGYSAPGDFTGEVGGDATFRFRAQSLPIGIAQPRGLGAIGQPSMLRVYRDAATPGAGTVGGIGVARTPSSLLAPMAPSTAGLRVYQQPSDQLDGESTMLGGRIGYVLSDEGRVMRMAASPLRGLHTQPLDDQGRALSPHQQARIDQYMAQFEAASQMPDEDDIPGSAPAVRPDPRMNTGLDTRVTTPTGVTLDQQIAAIAARQAGEQGSRQAQPGSDVYADLMAQIRAQRGEAPPPAAEQESRVVPLTEQAQAPDAPGPDSAQRPGVAESAAPGPVVFEGARMRPPSIEQMLEAEAQRREAERADAQRRAAAGLPPLETGEADQQAEQSQPTAPAVPDALVYKLPPLPSLAAAERTDRVNTLLREAEQLMIEGAYFRALDRYRQAEELNRGNPLIHVGRLHAQVGGGMLRSAAHTARQLFQAHPELIAARYDARLLPAPDRLETIRQQLEELAAATEGRSSDAGLLLAYLGYQTGTADLTRYGLDLAAAGDPGDPLLTLLRGIWLSDEAQPSGETGETQPPTSEPTADPIDEATDPSADQPADPPAADGDEPVGHSAGDSRPVEVAPAQEQPTQAGDHTASPDAPAQPHDADDSPLLDLDALDAALEPEK